MLSTVLILQGFGISLGVGASTLAVTNFFVAIWDGIIDEAERRMMGIAYIILRIAMILILTTSTGLAVYELMTLGVVSTFNLEILSLSVILFINAALMTLHLIPSTFGPSIQASAWYAMGFISLFRLIDLEISLYLFPIVYFAAVIFAVMLVNFLMLLAKTPKGIID